MSTIVVNAFPWPQFELRSSRRESAQTSSPKDQSGLTSAATIAKIDAVATAVLSAYGFNAKRDLLAQLLALNQEVAAKIEKGETVVAPGVPQHYPDAKKLITKDCIQAGGANRDSAYAEPPAAPTHPGVTPEKAYGDAAHYYSAKENSPPYGTKE